MAHSKVIPYYRKYFYEFAGFDLDKRWKLPWNSLYAVGGEGSGVSYPNDHTAVIKQDGKEYRIDNYYCIGGNVHWTPNGRGQYDLDSPSPVLSTIEHYRLFDGPDGKDLAEPWTIAKFAKYRDMAPDCMGPWLVYWRTEHPRLRQQVHRRQRQTHEKLVAVPVLLSDRAPRLRGSKPCRAHQESASASAPVWLATATG